MSRHEEIEQAKVIKWSHKVATRDVLPALKWLHHSPNGGKRDAFTGAQMKALGVKKGFPDLILPVRTEMAVGLVIEMKTDTGRTTPEQKEWLEHLTSQGWATFVARSAVEARLLLCQYLGVHADQTPALE